MADDRIKKYWSKEMEALLDIYQQFQTLLPSEKNAGHSMQEKTDVMWNI